MLISWILCAFLLIAVVMLFLKNLIMKISLNEICTELEEHLSNESNILITVSSRDKHIRHLAAVLNEQLRLLRKQRRQYLDGGRELKEAVTTISHDLRTPLTAICGYLDLLEEEEKSASANRYIQIINGRVETLKQLTEELFRYSVILVSERNTVKEFTVLNEMLEEAIAGFYAVLKEHHIDVKVRMPQLKISRRLDPSILSRVLSNLLNNAMKYSGGDLEITLSETGEITFSNTAPGLNQVQVGKLFNRFYTVQTAEKSTGLGLGITRAFVQQMDGTISAEYENNRLSISIFFPETD